MEKIIVDARGDACPLPVVKAIKALEGIGTEGGSVEVHVDNQTAVENVMRMASGRGLSPVSERLEDSHFVIRFDADASSSAPATAQEIACAVPAAERPTRTVVAVDSAVMGRGNDELGATLMKGFIFALSQLEKLPSVILFYNGGAKITTEGSPSIQDLKSMEEKGVEIYTCGTCLNYYGLTDKLQVGKVTNMYSIVETLAGADKIIKP